RDAALAAVAQRQLASELHAVCQRPSRMKPWDPHVRHFSDGSRCNGSHDSIRCTAKRDRMSSDNEGTSKNTPELQGSPLSGRWCSRMQPTTLPVLVVQRNVTWSPTSSSAP